MRRLESTTGSIEKHFVYGLWAAVGEFQAGDSAIDFMLSRNNPVAWEHEFRRDLPYCKKIITEAVAIAQIEKREFQIQGHGEEMERRELMSNKRAIGQ